MDGELIDDIEMQLPQPIDKETAMRDGTRLHWKRKQKEYTNHCRQIPHSLRYEGCVSQVQLFSQSCRSRMSNLLQTSKRYR